MKLKGDSSCPNSPPPPPPLRTLLVGTLLTLALPAAVLAQTPPRCHSGICTVTLEPVRGRIVVDGCGDHARPGQMRLTLSSSNPNVTRGSLNISLGHFGTSNQERAGAEFTDWEFRRADVDGGAWTDVSGGIRSIPFAGGQLGGNIIEVRPKAGARIWSNRVAGQPIQGPGPMVIVDVDPPVAHGQYTSAGGAYFLFMGGKGCERFSPWF